MRLDRRLLLAGATAFLSGKGGAEAQELPRQAQATLGLPVPSPAPMPDLEVVELWPGEPPGGGGPTWPDRRFDETVTGIVNAIAKPCLYVARPEKPNGAAVLVAPGGGYLRIDLGHEGVPVAAWLAKAGITAFVLVYRLPGEGWDATADAPRQDAQRAMRLIRFHAGSYGLDPQRIGVLGFSAGGHLMGEQAVAPDAELYDPIDDADALSARPALAGLIYPVVTMLAPFDRTISSRRVLIGNAPTDADRREYSIDVHVSDRTAPVFLAQAGDDPIAVVDHPLLMFKALRAAGVPTELHVFERGGHGFGLGVPGTPTAAWPGLFLTWARGRGFLKA